ncbi:MAG: hypothetical protein MJ184_11020 [Treponema sp.]|uniref:hypothetical protein n=1 Tax=Treponema sp. TaxID=166 RepID=UPI00298ECADC|nr:hypothetical protein [Treponema sp.]MCQ2601879.1 hypothetical protein [Treponema sp.]
MFSYSVFLRLYHLPFSEGLDCCAAGNVVIDTLTEDGFLRDVVNKGDYIREIIKSWGFPIVKDVRGKGLMVGVQIDESVKPFDIEVKALEEGLCTAVSPSVFGRARLDSTFL